MLKADKRTIIYIALPILAFVVAASIAIVTANRKGGVPYRPNVKLSQEYSTYDELIERSPIIVTAMVVSGNEELKYEDISFAITEVAVNSCVRGDLDTRSLRVLQTKSVEDPYLAEGAEVLLFLSKYSGPVANDVYVINGLYNGQYEIKNGMLYEAGLANKSAPILKKTLLSDVLYDIENTEYRSIDYTTASPAEIERENEEERALEAEKHN